MPPERGSATRSNGRSPKRAVVRVDLHAVNCRSNHLHVVVSADDTRPGKIRSDLKVWATRCLKQHAAPSLTLRATMRNVGTGGRSAEAFAICTTSRASKQRSFYVMEGQDVPSLTLRVTMAAANHRNPKRQRGTLPLGPFRAARTRGIGETTEFVVWFAGRGLEQQLQQPAPCPIFHR